MKKIPAKEIVNSLQEIGVRLKIKFHKTISSLLSPNSSQPGFSSLAVVALLGLGLAVLLTLIGTGTIKIPGSRGIPVSPIPFSDPVEDDEACNDPYNADCESQLSDPEDLTPEEIQKALED